jgi:hypothetical protein
MEIKIEDLLKTCPKCQGEPVAVPNYLKGAPGTPTLESCEPCQQCKGVGAIPTPMGQVLLDFIARTKNLTGL